MSCCQVCGKTDDLSLCGRCRSATHGAYCSREHQIADWHRHRPWCSNTNTNTNNSQATTTTNTNNLDDSIIQQQGLELQHELTTQQLMQQSSQPNALFANNNNNNDSFLPSTNPSSSNADQLDQLVADLEEANLASVIDNQPHTDLSMFNSHPMPQSSTAMMDDLFCANQINPQILNMQTSTASCLKNIANVSQNGNYTNLKIPMPSQESMATSSSASLRYEIPGISSDCRDAVFQNLQSYCNIVLKDMNQYGFCVIDNFLRNGESILAEVGMLYNSGLFRAGQVLNSKVNPISAIIRGDRIIWVEGNEHFCNNIGFLIRVLDSVIYQCNTKMCMGEFLKYKIRRRTKAMIACYPGNYTKYVRHIDNPNHDGRCITSIFYLNKNFNRERDGGILRLFPQMNNGIVADIEPLFNRVIFFWSDRRNPHEVMPSLRLRFAITVWYFDNEERQKVLQNYKDNCLPCPADRDLDPFMLD